MNLQRFFIFLFLLISANVSQAKLVDGTIALVNSEVILHSDLEGFQKNFSLRKELDPFLNLTELDLNGRQNRLEYLIQEQLVLQKMSPTKDEVEEEINAVQRNNRIDRDKLREVLSGQGVKFEDYANLMKVSLGKRKLVERELRPLSAVTDEEVKNYYYTAPEFQGRRKSQQLVLSYTLQQLILPSQDLAELAQRRLKAGADFDSLSEELASRGVDKTSLGTISEDKMNSTIRNAIQGLKVGESTQAISTGGAYIILKVSSIGAPVDPIFEKEKESIRNQLFQKALRTQLKLWTDRERAQSYVHLP